MSALLARLRDAWATMLLCARLVAGRRFWLAPLLPLAWTAYRAITLLAGWREEGFAAQEAQFGLIGFPLTVLATGLGVRIIAGEIEQRTLEVSYTVPGGIQRVFLSKLAAAVLMLLAAEILLAIATAILFTSFPPAALYRAFQGAFCYLILSMSLGALFRAEITGLLASLALFFFNMLATGFGEVQSRFSPFFNPVGLDDDRANVVAWTVQNHIGYALAMAFIVVLTFSRAERRERLLG
jgi:hypothetical protein